MQDSTALKITAIMGLSILEGAAICTGFDGAYFGIVVAAVAGLAGYTIAVEKTKEAVVEAVKEATKK